MNSNPETARTPQTFEEWCCAWWKANGWTSGPPQGLYSGDSLRACWDAALASQQAEGDVTADQGVLGAHQCDLPEPNDERQEFVCPVCWRAWYVQLEWGHYYNSDNTEYSPVERCQFCNAMTRKGYIRCDQCHRERLDAISGAQL